MAAQRPPLTRRQRDIVAFIAEYIEAQSISPTLEEIAAHFGVNKVTIFGHVAELERKGVLRKAARGISRGLQLIEPEEPHAGEPHAGANDRGLGAATSSDSSLDGPGSERFEALQRLAGWSQLQVLGRIAAGAPIETIEHPDPLDLGSWLPDDRDVYALHVRGDSMIEDAIQDGDVVLVERRAEVKDGEIVVAVLPDETATLKRLYREPSDAGAARIRLQPANATMDPIILEGPAAEHLEVRGVVIGVVRRYG